MNFPKLTITIPQSCTQSCNSNLPATSLNAVPDYILRGIGRTRDAP